MERPDHKWIVGIDLRPRSAGAIAYAVWLARTMKEEPKTSVKGVHIVEIDALLPQLRYASEEVVEGALQHQADRAMQAMAMEAHLSGAQVIRGTYAEESLEAAAVLHRADALIVGRRAATDEISLNRLGRVARRLLRMLALPVIVTPPELHPASIGEGPVFLALDPTVDSIDSYRFARETAQSLGRELAIGHVVPIPDRAGYGDLSGASEWLRYDEELEKNARERVMAWIDNHVKGAAPRVVLDRGPKIPTLRRLAEQEKACMIVCSSRQLSLGQRIFQSSVGSELAAGAPIPVAVVAPGCLPQSYDDRAGTAADS